MFVYRVYYNNELVYVGRTKDINKRISQHIHSLHLDIEKISNIEYAELDTESDMNLYELYYILKYKPILNEKDIAKDELTVDLPELEFKEFYSYLWEDWKIEVRQLKEKNKLKQQRKNILKSLQNKNNTSMANCIIKNEFIMNDF